jgi:hypothetical protein
MSLFCVIASLFLFLFYIYDKKCILVSTCFNGLAISTNLTINRLDAVFIITL